MELNYDQLLNVDPVHGWQSSFLMPEQGIGNILSVDVINLGVHLFSLSGFISLQHLLITLSDNSYWIRIVKYTFFSRLIFLSSTWSCTLDTTCRMKFVVISVKLRCLLYTVKFATIIYEKTVENHISERPTEHKVVPFHLRGCLKKSNKHSTKICEYFCEQCDFPVCEERTHFEDHISHELVTVTLPSFTPQMISKQ